MLIHITNLLLFFLPATRLFAFKRFLWRSCGAEMGSGTSLNQGVYRIGTGVISIGENTWIGLRCGFIVPAGSAIVVGARCDFAPEVMFVVGSHEIGSGFRRAGVGKADPIRIGEGCWIGARATILGGANLGRGTIVGAGSVVLPGNYPPDVLIAGTPAHVIRTLT